MMNKVVNKFINTGRVTQSRIYLVALPEAQSAPETLVTPSNRTVRNPSLASPKKAAADVPKKPQSLNDIFFEIIALEPQFATVPRDTAEH